MDDQLDELLQSLSQMAFGEPALFPRMKQAFAKKRRQPLGGFDDQQTRFSGGQVAPFLFRSAQLLVQLRQNLVLERTLLSNIQLEVLPLFSLQTRGNKEPEGTSCEFLQPADGGAKHRSVELL